MIRRPTRTSRTYILFPDTNLFRSPGDIIGLKDGRMRYSMLLDGDGGILDDLMVTRRSDGIYIVVNGATKYDDIAYLREHLPDEITINHMDEQALLALQGPKAIQALSRLVAGVDDLVFMQAGSFRWRDHDLWIRDRKSTRLNSSH